MTPSDALHSGTQTRPIMAMIEWFKCFFGAVYEGEPPLCSAPPMPSPGSGDALLRPRPLRTGRAAPTASGSSKPRGLAGGQQCWAAAGAQAAAVSVHKEWCGRLVRRAVTRVAGDRRFADRLTDGLEPFLKGSPSPPIQPVPLHAG